jgi:type III pantothenate kinase
MSALTNGNLKTKLLLDVGNTSTTWGIRDDAPGALKIAIKGFVDTHPLTSLGKRIQESVKEKTNSQTLDEIWVGSVVRGATPILEKTFGIEKLHRILPTTIRGIPNKTLEPEKVGADRLINVKAALRLFKPPMVIVDSGTAITLCAVNRQGEYLGGAILPGLKLSRDVLSEKTSLLPSVEIRAPAQAIGRNTEEALHTGIVLAASHAIRGLYGDFVKQMKETPEQVTFIGTGGNMELLQPFIPELNAVDIDLTLKGIAEVSHE